MEANFAAQNEGEADHQEHGAGSVEGGVDCGNGCEANHLCAIRITAETEGQVNELSARWQKLRRVAG
jgi:hypothetical protein